MRIKLDYGYNYEKEVKQLFSEYTDMLVKNDPKFAEYLKIQNYDHEVDNLKEKYGLPEGRLYVAKVDDNIIAGCIGLKKIDNERCEMKRLYIKPEYRGNKVAEKLVDKIINDARKTGYKIMLLDTLPFLSGAIHLYKKLGFKEVESYNNSPMDNSIYMKLNL